jgi:hypothetical protein
MSKLKMEKTPEISLTNIIIQTIGKQNKIRQTFELTFSIAEKKWTNCLLMINYTLYVQTISCKINMKLVIMIIIVMMI